MLCPSIDGPPVPDSRPLPTVTGQDGYMYGCVYVCVCVIDTQSVFDTYIYSKEMSVCVFERQRCLCMTPDLRLCVTALCVSMCVNEEPPGCHRSPTHQAST